LHPYNIYEPRSGAPLTYSGGQLYFDGEMMSTDRDVRDAILLLANACNDYQTRNLALASAFRALQLYPDDGRVSLCESDLQAQALKAYNDAEANAASSDA
jgi:hypothetical protein